LHASTIVNATRACIRGRRNSYAKAS
jgi:hypothetical protein